MSKDKIKIALIVGGTSSERDVSKDSSKSILVALKNLGYKYKIIDPAYGLNQPASEEEYFTKNSCTGLSNRNYIEIINSPAFDDVDLAFIGLHGKWGEDGTIQSLFELREIKYTGSGILPSALAMNKHMSKIIFKHHGIPTPLWFLLDKNNNKTETVKKQVENSFGFPCIIKPNDQGSTVGLSICENAESFDRCVNMAFDYSASVMIEEYIVGRELTVGILGDKILPVLEIIPKHGLYDYECKYTDGMSEYIVPADIPDKVRKTLEDNAATAFNALDCASYGRVDFKVNNKNEAFCLEVNTLPGMTSHSLVPKMAKAAGISFDEVIERIIREAF